MLAIYADTPLFSDADTPMPDNITRHYLIRFTPHTEPLHCYYMLLYANILRAQEYAY